MFTVWTTVKLTEYTQCTVKLRPNFEKIAQLKGSVVKITLKHGLKPGIFLRKRFGRFLWFFRSVIYNPNRKKCRLDFSCKSLYLIVFVHLKKHWHILDINRTPRNIQCIIFISAWTWWANLKTLDWIFWNDGHSAFNHAFSKVSPEIEWN